MAKNNNKKNQKKYSNNNKKIEPIEIKIVEEPEIEEKPQVLQTEERMYDILEEPTVNKSGSTMFVIILLIVCVISNIGIVYYFKTHPKIKIKTKTVIKKEYKVPENIVFLGDSITNYYDLKKYYPDNNIVNSGICGNTTGDILNDMEERVYQYNPSKVFLLIGINDLAYKSTPDEIIENTEKIVEAIQEKRPQAEILVESVYPTNNSDDSKIYHDLIKNRDNEDVEKINEGLKKYCEDKKIKYIDLHSKLVDEDGNLKLEYTKEGLHISEEGYEVITEELKKYINEEKN